MLRRLSIVALALPAMLIARDAAAIRTPDYLSERPLETADGGPGRLVRHTQHRPTPAGAAAWKAFTAAHGSWQGLWDEHTGVPARIWGEGIAAPGASADPARAELAARALLAEQLALLAPGTKLEHWRLAANVAHGRGGALRTVSFTQVFDGVPVVDGAVSFLFKRDRMIVMGSRAQRGVAVTIPRAPVDGAAATGKAIAWIAGIYGAAPTVLAIGDVVVLPSRVGRPTPNVLVPSTRPWGPNAASIRQRLGVPLARLPSSSSAASTSG